MYDSSSTATAAELSLVLFRSLFLAHAQGDTYIVDDYSSVATINVVLAWELLPLSLIFNMMQAFYLPFRFPHPVHIMYDDVMSPGLPESPPPPSETVSTTESPLAETVSPSVPKYYGVTTLQIPITFKLSPEAQVLVHYVTDDGEIIADSINIKVQQCTANQVSNS